MTTASVNPSSRRSEGGARSMMNRRNPKYEAWIKHRNKGKQQGGDILDSNTDVARAIPSGVVDAERLSQKEDDDRKEEWVAQQGGRILKSNADDAQTSPSGIVDAARLFHNEYDGRFGLFSKSFDGPSGSPMTPLANVPDHLVLEGMINRAHSKSNRAAREVSECRETASAAVGGVCINESTPVQPMRFQQKSRKARESPDPPEQYHPKSAVQEGAAHFNTQPVKSEGGTEEIKLLQQTLDWARGSMDRLKTEREKYNAEHSSQRDVGLCDPLQPKALRSESSDPTEEYHALLATAAHYKTSPVNSEQESPANSEQETPSNSEQESLANSEQERKKLKVLCRKLDRDMEELMARLSGEGVETKTVRGILQEEQEGPRPSLYQSAKIAENILPSNCGMSNGAFEIADNIMDDLVSGLRELLGKAMLGESSLLQTVNALRVEEEAAINEAMSTELASKKKKTPKREIDALKRELDEVKKLMARMEIKNSGDIVHKSVNNAALANQNQILGQETGNLYSKMELSEDLGQRGTQFICQGIVCSLD